MFRTKSREILNNFHRQKASFSKGESFSSDNRASNEVINSISPSLFLCIQIVVLSFSTSLTRRNNSLPFLTLSPFFPLSWHITLVFSLSVLASLHFTLLVLFSLFAHFDWLLLCLGLSISFSFYFLDYVSFLSPLFASLTHLSFPSSFIYFPSQGLRLYVSFSSYPILFSPSSLQHLPLSLSQLFFSFPLYLPRPFSNLICPFSHSSFTTLLFLAFSPLSISLPFIHTIIGTYLLWKTRHICLQLWWAFRGFVLKHFDFKLAEIQANKLACFPTQVFIANGQAF